MKSIQNFLLEDNYKYKSKNTLNHISLHDCFVNKILIEDAKMLFCMSHMEILDSHPLNNMECAQCSDEGIIYFDKMKICNIALCDEGIVTLSYPKFIAVFEGIEILEAELLGEENGLSRLHFVVDRHEPQSVIGEFDVIYNEASICWNNFEHDSWFVNW